MPLTLEANDVANHRSLPPHRRRMVRFSLASLLLLMIPLGLAFVWLGHYLDNRPIAWVPYSAKSLKSHLHDGHAVLVNFRASWDLSTGMHEKFALERPKVRQAIRSGNVVAMRADWTDGSPEIEAALQSLGRNSIPLIVVYPASRPERPIVLADVITEEQVLKALAQARSQH